MKRPHVNKTLITMLAISLSTQGGHAQKAPVEIGFSVSGATRGPLQAVPILVEYKPTALTPFVGLSTSAADNGVDPGSITATNLKAKQIADVKQTVLTTTGESGYLNVQLTAQERSEFETLATNVSIPLSHKGDTVSFGKPLEVPAGTVASKLSGANLKATQVEAAMAVDGYKATAKLDIGFQKGGLSPSSIPSGDLQVHISTEGGVSVLSQKPLPSSMPASEQLSTTEIPFAIKVGDRGALIGQVSANDAQGKLMYARKTVLYILSEDRKLYTGTSGYTELEVQKLKDDLAEGKISPAQYDRAVTRAVTGGTSTPK